MAKKLIISAVGYLMMKMDDEDGHDAAAVVVGDGFYCAADD